MADVVRNRPAIHPSTGPVYTRFRLPIHCELLCRGHIGACFGEDFQISAVYPVRKELWFYIVMIAANIYSI
jgi:hypothetical protein